MTMRARLPDTSLVSECPVCGAVPCRNPSFCATCRAADARKTRGARLRYINDGHDSHSAPPKHRPRPTPRSTVEAIKEAVRARGLGALYEPATESHLRACDLSALADIDRWLSRDVSR
jgi:hypothetical protein